MPQENMDPNLVLLYQCIQTVGTKMIDFKQVGQALGVNDTAARMRYRRLESRMKAGGFIKTRVTSNVIRSVKNATPKSKPFTPAIRKRKKLAKYESNSTTSSRCGDGLSNNAIEFELEERPAKRRTRGVQLDLKEAFDENSQLGAEEDSDSSIDEYKEPIKKKDDGEEDDSDIDYSPKVRKDSNKALKIARNRRSGPSITIPRRLGSSARRASSLTSSGTISRFTKTQPSLIDLDYDNQIKRELSQLKVGMTLPLANASDESLRAPSIESTTANVTMSDIIESIERDEEEEEAVKDSEKSEEEVEHEESDADEEDEVYEEAAEKTVLNSPVQKKSNFFRWLL